MTDHTLIISLDEVDSTNNFLCSYQGEEGKRMTVARAEYQTAGRGQGVNTWESQTGKNLTFSAKICPLHLPASRQFVLLQAGALAVRDVLAAFVDGITIKWPNDIYWHDKKLSGTLSQCSIHGMEIGYCILGIGVNVNQLDFVSDAPNPVSLANILEHEVDREEVFNMIIKRLETYFAKIDERLYDQISDFYKHSLYRREGFWPYKDSQGEFEAAWQDVLDNGHLVLQRHDGTLSEYEFKEVKFKI